MNRLDQMRDRLPPVWSSDEGTLTRAVLALFATHMAAYDEDMARTQRARWVETAVDMADLVKIGALFRIAPAPWERERLFRARLMATIAARLRGAVCRDSLEAVLVAILAGAQAALGTRFADLPASAGEGAPAFHTGPDGPAFRPAFVEFPARRRRAPDLVATRGLMRPLARVTLRNAGLGPVPLGGAIRGVAGGRTAVPLIANLTTGQVMAYRGAIACGQTLAFGATGDGGLVARLDGRDVSGDVLTGAGFAPGAAFRPVPPDPAPRAPMLARGANLLWVLPLALYDAPGLGSAVFAMPEADVGHGRWEGAGDAGHPPFGKALFDQPPAMALDLFWDEAAPARFRFLIPAGVVRREAPRPGAAPAGAARPDDARTERARLFALMQQTVDDLSAAGVTGEVLPRPLRTTQAQGDRLRVLDPTRLAETQPQTSRLAGLSALFDLSASDGARFG